MLKNAAIVAGSAPDPTTSAPVASVGSAAPSHPRGDDIGAVAGVALPIPAPRAGGRGTVAITDHPPIGD